VRAELSEFHDPFRPQTDPSECTESGTSFAKRQEPVLEVHVQLAHSVVFEHVDKHVAKSAVVKFDTREALVRAQSLIAPNGMDKKRLALIGCEVGLETAREKITAGTADATGSPGTSFE